MKSLLSAAALAVLPAFALAQGTTGPAGTAPTARPVVPAPSSPDLIFTLRGGITGTPDYFGADSYEPGVDFALGFEYLDLGGYTFGSTDPNEMSYGIVPRGSLRVVKERSAGENPELRGLNDIDLSVELGLGVGFRAENFQAFADARYGVIGHESWVGELGADVIARPTDRLTITAGPRLFIGDDDYAATYFGVTRREAGRSRFPAFSASGGALSAGVEVGATYALNDIWGVSGAVRYDRLINDAEASPITARGSADQFSVRLGLVRRFALEF